MTRIRSGLCSITYRQLRPAEIVDLAQAAGIDGIEWGGDVHVPPGDLSSAADVAARCADAGIEIPSYGSYLGVVASGTRDDVADARRTFRTAEALDAPLVRIWTPLGVGPDSPPDERLTVMRWVARAAQLAEEHDLHLALEFHSDTLTETAASARRLLDEVDHPRLHTHWQPDHRLHPEAALSELDAVSPWLAHLHVFSWGDGGYEDRLPLASGAPLWRPVLDRVAEVATFDGGDRFALLEHIEDDDPAHLRRDADTLRAWIGSLPARRPTREPEK